MKRTDATLESRLVGRSNVCQHCNGCTFDGKQNIHGQLVIQQHPVIWNDGLVSLLLLLDVYCWFIGEIEESHMIYLRFGNRGIPHAFTFVLATFDWRRGYLILFLLVLFCPHSQQVCSHLPVSWFLRMECLFAAGIGHVMRLNSCSC